MFILSFHDRLKIMMSEGYTWRYLRGHFCLSDAQLRNEIRAAFSHHAA